MEDLYRILQVDPAAEPEVIEAAWRRLARIYHPDGQRPDSVRMTAINRAHDILKDPIKRAEYDRRRVAAANTTPGGRPQPPRPQPPRPQPPRPPRWSPPGEVACWRHPSSPAVTSCPACHVYLCASCAAHWPGQVCDACVRGEAIRRQLQIIWPGVAVAAWFMIAALELEALVVYGIGISSPIGLLAMAFYLGAGTVGAADLAWMIFSRFPQPAARAIGALSWLAMLLLCPVSLLAGSVMVFVRAGHPPLPNRTAAPTCCGPVHGCVRPRGSSDPITLLLATVAEHANALLGELLAFWRCKQRTPPVPAGNDTPAVYDPELSPALRATARVDLGAELGGKLVSEVLQGVRAGRQGIFVSEPERLRTAIFLRGYTLGEFARFAGMAPSTLSRALSGQPVAPSSWQALITALVHA